MRIIARSNFISLRSIAEIQQKILQRPCGVAGDFSTCTIPTARCDVNQAQEHASCSEALAVERSFRSGQTRCGVAGFVQSSSLETRRKRTDCENLFMPGFL